MNSVTSSARLLSAYLSLDEVAESVTEIEGLCQRAEDPAEVPAVVRDPDDDYLVALAVGCGADSIVSGDLDLRDATGLPVAVLTPREAVSRLGG